MEFIQRDVKRAARSAAFQSARSFPVGKSVPGYTGFISSSEAVPIPVKIQATPEFVAKKEQENAARVPEPPSATRDVWIAPTFRSEYTHRFRKVVAQQQQQPSPPSTTASSSSRGQGGISGSQTTRGDFNRVGGENSSNVAPHPPPRYGGRAVTAGGPATKTATSEEFAMEEEERPQTTINTPRTFTATSLYRKDFDMIATRPTVLASPRGIRPNPETKETVYGKSYDRGALTTVEVPKLRLSELETQQLNDTRRQSANFSDRYAAEEDARRIFTQSARVSISKLNSERPQTIPSRWTPRSLYQDHYTRKSSNEFTQPEDVSRHAHSREFFEGTPKITKRNVGYGGFIPASEENATARQHGFGEKSRKNGDFLLFNLQQMPRFKPGFGGYLPLAPQNNRQWPREPTETTTSQMGIMLRDKAKLKEIADARNATYAKTNETTKFFQLNPGGGDSQLADAALYYSILRPYEGLAKTDRPSEVTECGYRFDLYD